MFKKTSVYKSWLLSLAASALLISTVPVMAENPDPSIYPDLSQIDPKCLGDYVPGDPPVGWPDADAFEALIQQATDNPGYVLPQEFKDHLNWDLRSPEHLADQTQRCNLLPPLVSIPASEAFDAFQSQKMTAMDMNGNMVEKNGVMFIDVRTTEEQYWIGVPAQVEEIHLKTGEIHVPDNYKAILDPQPSDNQGPRLVYSVNGQKMKTKVENVSKTTLKGIVYNAPVEFWNTDTQQKTLNDTFGLEVDALIANAGVQNAIFYCRSGQRSSTGCYYRFCPNALFFGVLSGQLTVYEVEAPLNGYGGFESTSGSNRYLGYRGFPGRVTDGVLPVESVSFKDTGLPITIGKDPVNVLNAADLMYTPMGTITPAPIIDVLPGNPYSVDHP